MEIKYFILWITFILILGYAVYKHEKREDLKVEIKKLEIKKEIRLIELKIIEKG